MSNQPPYPGQQGPQGPGGQGGGNEPQNPYGPPPPYGSPQPNPYGQTPANPYETPQQQGPYPPQQQPGGYPQQPLWQGQQAPQQGFQGGGPQGPPPAKRSGKGKWIALIVVLVVLAAAAVVTAVVLTNTDDGGGSPPSVAGLEAGECIDSSDVADANEKISEIDEVACDESHDAEVFSTFELTSEEVSDFDLDAAGSKCVDLLADLGTSLDDLESDGNEVRPLVGSDDPEEGDKVVCFIRNSEGKDLSSQIVEQ